MLFVLDVFTMFTVGKRLNYAAARFPKGGRVPKRERPTWVAVIKTSLISQ